MLTVVELPGGLAPAGAGEPLITEAELGPLGSEDEAWLAGLPSHLPTAHVVTELLERVVTRLGPAAPPARDALRALPAGDRDYLLLTLRRLTLGPRMVAVLECPECGNSLDAEFGTQDVPVERRPTAERQAEVRRGDGAAIAVRFRGPTGADQEALALAPGDAADGALLERCVVAVDGRAPTPALLERLDAEARGQLDAAIEAAAPRVDLAMDLTCPECGAAF